MLLPLLLFLLPLATAVILLLTRDASFRTLLVKGSAAVMMGLALAVAVTCFDEPVKIGVDSELLKAVMLAADFMVILAVCYYAKKFKRYSIALLGLVQFAIVTAFEWHMGDRIYVSWDFLIDHFTIIMILIAGIIGGLIAVYSLGYMAQYHRKHAGIPDRRGFFFFVQ